MSIGLQLYSVRDEMGKDFEGTLKAVSEIGYDCVEFAGYYDRSAEEIKAMLDKYNLTAPSVHQKYPFFLEDGQKKVDFLKTLGVKYVAIPHMERECHMGGENFEKAMKDIKTVSRLLKDNGIELLYHNHNYELGTYNGKILLDGLFETLSSDIINAEIDTGWVEYAGIDTCQYLKKHKGRVPLIHIKDFVANGCDEEGKPNYKFKPIGKGIVDIPSVLSAANYAGCKYCFVELEDFSEYAPLDQARISCEYLKSISL